MSTRIGRNDPCHCGSGKKYKRCHLPLDQQRKPVVEKPPQQERQPAGPAASLQETTALLRTLSRNAGQHERAKWNDLLKQATAVADYVERQSEIEGAVSALEPYRGEFSKLLADQKACRNQARILFQEERFRPLRFTAEDIRRAFDHLGGPPDLSVSNETAKTLLAAIFYLADKSQRAIMGMGLLNHLPDYVKAGRFMDGWLIESFACATLQLGEESNQFLYEMFVFGFDAWASEQKAGELEFMRDFGLDPARLQNMSPDEIETWLQEQEADPAKKKRVEAFMNVHPERRELAAATIQRMEAEFVTLLQREDARALLLSREEVNPWLPALLESWRKTAESDPKLAESSPAEEASKNAFQHMLDPVIDEMAHAIFTPQRIKRLVIQLDRYQKELFAAGDKAAAACIMAAIRSLKRTKEPARNYFLMAVCFASMRALLESMAAENPAGTDENV